MSQNQKWMLALGALLIGLSFVLINKSEVDTTEGIRSLSTSSVLGEDESSQPALPRSDRHEELKPANSLRTLDVEQGRSELKPANPQGDDLDHLQLKLLSESDGSALAHFPVWIGRWKAREDPAAEKRNKDNELEHRWAVSDSEGLVRTPWLPIAGTLRIQTPDYEAVQLRLPEDHAEREPVEVRLAVGPRILLDFVPTGELKVSDYVAGLYRAPRELLAYWSCSFSNPNSENDPTLDMDEDLAMPVVDGPQPWVRLSSEDWKEPLPSVLYLLSRDGKSFGSARLDSFEQSASVPLHVNVGELNVIDLEIRWPPDDALFIDFTDLAVRRSDGRVDRSIPVGREGEEEITHLRLTDFPPGELRITPENEDLELQIFSVTAPTKTPLRMNLTARPLQKLHSVTVILRTSSGLPLDGAEGRAALRYLDIEILGTGRQEDRTLWLTHHEDGTARGSIDLPAGDHRLTPWWEKGWLSASTTDLLLHVPGGTHEVTFLDQLETHRYQLRLHLPDSEMTSFPVAWVHTDNSPGPDFLWFVEDPIDESDLRVRSFQIGPVDARAKLQVEIDEDGMMPISLTDSDFTAANADGIRHAEATLRPQKNHHIFVHVIDGDPEDPEPCPAGVVLTVDGEELTPTDEEGESKLPTRLEEGVLAVATPGWRLVTRTGTDFFGSVFAESGGFTIEDGLLDIFITRTPR